MTLTCTYNALAHLVLLVDPVDLEDVVAEVERLEASLLVEENDQRAARPVETLAKQLSEGHKHTKVVSQYRQLLKSS